jgi:DNA-binding NtrC family response regulator
MGEPLRILSVEDDPKDAQLIRDLLETEGMVCEVGRVETEAALLQALGQGGIDLILADYTLPSFDGIAALKLAQKVCPEVPFIFVSGTLGEEVAIEALKFGATDYVLKTRLSRLVPSVVRALREARERAERKQADEKLRRSEAYLTEAQRLSQTGSFGCTLSTGEMFWSEETFRIYGYDQSTKPTVEHVLQRVHPEDKPLLQEHMDRASREGKACDVECRLLLPDDSVKHVRIVAHASKNESGIVQFIGAVMDVTATKQAEEKVRRSEAYLAEAQKLSHTGSFGWNVCRGDIYWSDETFRIFECKPTAKVTVELIVQRTHPEDRAAVQQLIARVSREGTEFDFEHRLMMPDGAVKYVHVVGTPSENEEGCLEFVGAVTDITERKRAEETLRRSEGYLAEAQRLTHSASWAWDVRTREVFWSQEMFRILDYDPDEVKPTLSLYFERVHPEDRHLIEQRAEVESTQKYVRDPGVDYRVVLPNGTTKYLHSISHQILNELGEITEVVGTTIDVTEQHQARTALETAFEQINALKDQLYKENVALREEIDRSSMFEEIVGGSRALQAVLALVVKVAPTDSTVLLTGETGTGKELIARAIHKRSQRSARAFVSVNCAAIPPSLIASELFGHEKGAFTGATQRRLGRFELAEGGTIFLDEIGELPSDIQIALLRVLQEREFERLGGAKVLRADVRVIAATNRDLLASVDAGTFRSDLYYRLNVFPIEMPPLRKRKEDIHLLVEYFIDRYARKAGKKIRGISRATLDRLTTYAWPGNIRELQNVIERSVILCDSENFSVDGSWLSGSLEETSQADRPCFRMPATEEKKAIEEALADAQGRVSGPLGAAAKLGIPPSTLDSKIKTLKIDKHRFRTM